MEKNREITQTAAEKSSFDLIKGTFTAEEAQEILMHMLQKKIEFHELKIFSEEIRFSKEDEKSIQRIEELRISRKEVKAIVEQARKEGKKLKLNTTTTIEII